MKRAIVFILLFQMGMLLSYQENTHTKQEQKEIVALFEACNQKFKGDEQANLFKKHINTARFLRVSSLMKCFEGRTLLYHALECENFELVEKMLCEYGANPWVEDNGPNAQYRSAYDLFVAMARGDVSKYDPKILGAVKGITEESWYEVKALEGLMYDVAESFDPECVEFSKRQGLVQFRKAEKRDGFMIPHIDRSQALQG